VAITGIGGTSSNSGTTGETKLASSVFDGDAFMKLLLTQLRYQDPMNPMKDQEFMAQLAQMNTLSEMQKLNTNIEAMSETQSLTQGASLIGKAVQASTDSGDPTYGVVQAVRVQGNKVLLDLGQSTVALDDVQAVWEV
jgi:flagellar basal-body rod modification protein FlgD